MKRISKQIFVGLAIAVFVAAGCDFVDSVKSLMTLQEKMAKEFEADKINLNISNNDTLTVRMVNSPIFGYEKEERAAEAKTIAMFVKENAEQPFAFKNIAVQFVEEESFAIATMTEAEEPYVFALDALGKTKPDSLKP